MSLEQPTSSGPREPNPWRTAAIGTGVFVGLLWIIEIVDALMNHRLDQGGIRPREVDGLSGIVFAPVLHSGWSHLISNTVPALILCFVVLLSGIRVWARVTATVWLIAGVGTWLTGASHSLHLGASMLVFGWVVYLILRGFFHHNATHIIVGIVVFIFYGTMLLGVLPGSDGVSWQGHLFGALGGAVAAWWGDTGGRSTPRPVKGADDDPLAKYLAD